MELYTIHHCALFYIFRKILKKLKNLPPSGVRVMSWSRNWPNCITMWVNSLLPGFEPLSPGVLCIAFDTSRGPTFTWPVDVRTEAGNEQQIRKNFANLPWRVQVSQISRLAVIRLDQSTHPNGSRSPILVPQVVALAIDSANSVESLAVNSLTHAHFVCGSC